MSAEAALRRVVSQLPDYEARPQQLEMARAIEAAIRDRRHALIEAGTGSGKSFAYLIPLLESGQKAVVSTGTIALQEQLLLKDLPFLQQAAGRKINVALAKGRANYVCLRKLQEVDQTMGPLDPLREKISGLIQLSGSGQWRSGDRADLPFLVEPRFWHEALASDMEDCLGPRCPNFQFTPHRQAREALEAADLIVANHALYFTDLARGSGILPQHDVVVFDEAHHLERAAVGALTVSIHRWTLAKLQQRLQRRLPPPPLQLQQRLLAAETAALEVIFRRGRGQFPIEGDADLAETAAELAGALTGLAQWVAAVDPGELRATEMDGDQGRARAELQRDQMASVAAGLAADWNYFSRLDAVTPGTADRANWLRVEPSRDAFELHSAPLEVGGTLRESLWPKRTCILTSATLAVDGGFAFVRGELGIDQASEHVLGSPFQFERQALLYVPRHLPVPSSPHYLGSVVPLIEKLLHTSRGRAFVLFTSYRALREVAALLVPRLPYPCKTQEELPRQRLVEWFRSTPNSVLFATASFWEGIDIPGEALSCVIIDKLPFACPDDPVVQARTERMKARDEDWFNEYMLPRAVLALKQGFGRLIRSRTDTGLIAILDRRLHSMRYGEVILRSLPPARRIHVLPESLDAAFLPERKIPA